MSKYKLDKSAQVVENQNYTMTQEEVCERLNDLETKLAESESKRKILEEKVKWLTEENEECFVDGQKYNELREQKDKEIQDLKQQLAENQKEKEDFKTMYFNKCLDYEHLHEKFDDKCAEFELKEYDYKQTIFEKDQDKISFAIEQLEKVKGKIQHNILFVDGDDYLNVIEEIDNQINELKGKVEKKCMRRK